MYVDISPPTTKKSKELIEYLDKENSLSGQFVTYLDKENISDVDYFFNGEGREYEPGNVAEKIDKNCKGIGSDEHRFFPIIFSPSKDEIKHIENIADNIVLKIFDNKDSDVITSNKKVVTDSVIKNMLQNYTIKCMDSYALNFKRDGVKSNKDLV